MNDGGGAKPDFGSAEAARTFPILLFIYVNQNSDPEKSVLFSPHTKLEVFHFSICVGWVHFADWVEFRFCGSAMVGWFTFTNYNFVVELYND